MLCIVVLCCFQRYTITHCMHVHICVDILESQMILAVVVKTGPEWLTETSWDCLHVVSQPGPIYTTATLDDVLELVHARLATVTNVHVQ